MSASREKLRRKQQQPGSGTANKAGSDLNTVMFRNLVRVICVFLVISLIAVVLIGQGVPQQFMTAVNADGQRITVAEFNFFYYSSLTEFYNDLGNMLLQYGMLDTSVPLYRQESWYEDGSSWHDYVVDMTLSRIRSTVLWSESAKAEGISLTAEDIQLIDDFENTVKNSADIQGVSVNKLLSDTYGRGVNGKNLRKFMERQVLASRYETQLYESFDFTAQEIDDHYNNNKKLFDKVDYREFRVSKYVSDSHYLELADEYGEDFELSAMVDSPIGEITFEAKIAYDTVAALINDPELTSDNFNELAAELADEDDHSGHDHDHGDHDYSHDEDSTLVENGEYTEDAVGDWLFDESRRAGDLGIIDDDSDFVGVMFLGRTVEDDLTVTLRQILIGVRSDNDAGWNDAETRARALLGTLSDGGEQKFIDSVKDNTDDTSTRYSGGLYREMRSNMFEEDSELKDWLFDPARKPGDMEVIKGPNAWHILYFSGQGRPFRQVNVESALRGEKNNEIREGKAASSQDPKTNWFGMRIITRA